MACTMIGGRIFEATCYGFLKLPSMAIKETEVCYSYVLSSRCTNKLLTIHQLIGDILISRLK
jgi:hypothetical protein